MMIGKQCGKLAAAVLSAALALSGLPASLAVRAAEKKTVTYEDIRPFYSVDCGDFDVTTPPAGEDFGKYQSVTEQVYGRDAQTGHTWGIVDDYGVEPPVANKEQSNGKGIRTDWTWAHENGGWTVDSPKTSTNRYTKNQYENMATFGDERKLDYTFELPSGNTYDVELMCVDPWTNVSLHPTVWLNQGKEDEVSFAPIQVKTVQSQQIALKEDTLAVSFRGTGSDTAAINVAYIQITDARYTDLYRCYQAVAIDSQIGSNFTLPKGTDGCVVTWTSDGGAISIQGDQAIVARTDSEQNVRLTAEISNDEYVVEKQFSITVPAEEDVEPAVSFDFEEQSPDGYFDGHGAVAKLFNNPVVEQESVNGRTSQVVKLRNQAYLQLLDGVDAEQYSGLNGVDGVTVSFWENAQGNTVSWNFFARGERSINAGTGEGSGQRHYIAYDGRKAQGRIEKQNGNRNHGADIRNMPEGWRYVTLIYSENGASIYVNGRLAGEYTDHTPLSQILGGKQDAYLGHSPTWNNEYSDVWLDDVEIYTQALSAIQAEDLYERESGSRHQVTIRDMDGKEQHIFAETNEVVVCSSDRMAAWTINGVTLAIGKTFRHIVTGDVTIEALDPAGKEADGVAVEEGTQQPDGRYQFVANYGAGTTGKTVTYTFVSDDRHKAEKIVTDDYAGRQVQFTVETGGKTIRYVVARCK